MTGRGSLGATLTFSAAGLDPPGATLTFYAAGLAARGATLSRTDSETLKQARFRGGTVGEIGLWIPEIPPTTSNTATTNAKETAASDTVSRCTIFRLLVPTPLFRPQSTIRVGPRAARPHCKTATLVIEKRKNVFVFFSGLRAHFAGLEFNSARQTVGCSF